MISPRRSPRRIVNDSPEKVMRRRAIFAAA
jgi:hypothetical protein